MLWRLHYYINRYINVSTKYTQRLTQTKVTTSSVEYRKRRKVKEKVYKNNLIDFYQEQKISTDKSVQHKKKVFHFHPFVMIKKGEEDTTKRYFLIYFIIMKKGGNLVNEI